MDRREFLWKAGAAGIASAALAAGAAAARGRRPNIILIMTDDQGFGDLGVHGNDKINVPNLDRFAGESLEMTRFYVSAMCSPTRASLMTGRYHVRTGVLHTSRGAAKMAGDETTVAELLGGAGYKTGIFGKWHLGDNYPMRPQDQGFHETYVHRSGGIGQTPDTEANYFKPTLYHNGKRITPDGFCTDLFFDEAIRFVETNRGRPFFIYLPTNVPHGPYEIADSYVQPYLAAGLAEKEARIYGTLTNLDENFGKLLGKLDALGLRENTLVVFLSDNGGAGGRYNGNLRGSKGKVYEGGIRSPFFVRWPAGGLRGGEKIDRIAAHIDVLPTLLAAAGAPLPKDLVVDGVDLLPLWTGRVKPDAWPERTIFLQLVKSIIQQPLQNAAVVTQRHKLITYPDDLMTARFKPDWDNPELALYDLIEDPGEQKDIAKEKPEIVAELLKRYGRWYRDVERSRDFQPGVIHLGSDRENPSLLCRYQDGHYPFAVEEPVGWPVKVVRGGRYRVTLKWPDHPGGALRVVWRGETTRLPLKRNEKSGELTLKPGEGMLEIWFETKEGNPIILKNNSTQGDALVVRLGGLK